MKDITAQLQPILRGVQPVLKHHMFIMVLISLGFLIFTVYSINGMLQQPPDEAYRAEQEAKITQTKFDETTIERIERLGTYPDLGPRTRNSPFVE